ncbi:MAG: SDR family NAD(P)-dependent oxidoreductase [Actinomycetota bacterium]
MASDDTTSDQGVALILAAGDGIGAALAHRFSAGGYHTVAVRRSAERLDRLVADVHAQSGACTGLIADVRDEDQMVALFDRVEADIGPIEICVYNGGANTNVPIAETSGALFRKVWELCTFGAFLATRESARVMTPRGRGTILYSGATSGVRGKAGLIAFTSGKFGLRAIAQTAAKELGPLGIQAAHLLIDGGIKSEAVARLWKERAGIDVATLDDDLFIDQAALAETYWHVAHQPRNAWIGEVTIKPGASYEQPAD